MKSNLVLGLMVSGFVALAAAVSCGGSTSSNSCLVGSENCACTAGGACDHGLVCTMNHCVNPNSTTSSTTAGHLTTTSTSSAATSGSTGATGSSATSTSTAGTGATGSAATTSTTSATAGTTGTGPSTTTGSNPTTGVSAAATTVGAGGAPPVTGSSITTTGTGGAGGGGGAGGAPPGSDGGISPGTIGAPCKGAADCTGGSKCLLPADNLGPNEGPPNGVCTVDCTASTTACPAGTTCVAFDSAANAKAYCMQTCTPGVAASPANGKCHLRADFVCTPLTSGTDNACLPMCTSDADCGTRKCDPATGFCSTQVHTGKALGASCTTDAECAGGFCLPFKANPDGGPAPGTCSEFCRFGNTNAGCGFRLTPISAGPPVGACLYTGSSGMTGDLGACGQLCDKQSDCGTTAPGYTCVPEPTIQRIFGHGYCGFPAGDM